MDANTNLRETEGRVEGSGWVGGGERWEESWKFFREKIYIHMNTYAYICIHMHTYTYIYIHISIRAY